jgi:hypothetical protein
MPNPDQRKAAVDVVAALPADAADIDPVGHADLLEGVADEFAAQLRSSPVVAVATLYRESDREAALTQRYFRRTVGWANVMVFLTAVASAGLLALQALVDPETRWPYVALGVVGVLTGGAAATLIGLARDAGLLARWRTTRAAAEIARLRYFETLAGSADAATAPLHLEYFRRFAVDGQLAYHAGRRQRLGRALALVLAAGGAAVFLAAAANGLGGILGAVDPKLVAIAALAVVGTAAGSLATATASIGQFRENREHHDEVWRSLLDLTGRLDAVRAAVGAGDLSALSGFVEATHEIMRGEHVAWLQRQEKIAASLDELDTALSRARDKQPPASRPKPVEVVERTAP